MARLLLFSTWQAELYAALATSTDQTLAGVAGKAVKEVAYHLDHAQQWVLRLGDGTDESHAPHAGRARRRVALRSTSCSTPRPSTRGLVGRRRRGRPGRAPRGRAGPARAVIVASATLSVPEVAPAVGGGRRGPAHRGDGLPARRDAAPHPLPPGGDLVMSTSTRTRAWERRRPGARPRAARSSPSRTSASCATSPRTTAAASTCRSPRPTPAARPWRRSAPT